MEDRDSCPTCGGDLLCKEVETLLRGGLNTAAVRANVFVCSRCREHIYPIELVREFDRIKVELTDEHTTSFRRLGRSYEVDLVRQS